MRYNILTDPVIAIAGGGGRSSLPEVLAGLVADAIDGFRDLAPWQAHSWHAFLVQTAALALVRAGRTEPPAEADAWADLLRGLAAADGWSGGDEPWCLVVDDWTKPAFLQPPLPAATHKDLKPAGDRPDLLDVLITAKNHDVKAGRADRATPGHWLFALLSLQTMQGFSGNTLYGIARMNGGFSSRPALGLVPWGAGGSRPGARFLRDLRVLLREREGFFRALPYTPDGLGLVWLAPWDGARALDLEELDPWFIEVCRRVRLIAGDDGALSARAAGSKAARIDAKALAGILGDPWVPVDKAKEAALTVSGRGFHYDSLCELIEAKDYHPALLQLPHKGIDDGPVALLARVLVRGQGQTEGYHERLVPVPFARLVTQQGRDHLGKVSKKRIENVKELSRKVLYPALRRLLRPRDGDDGMLPPGEKAWVGKWLDDLDRRVDAAFFDRLWGEVEAELDHDTPKVDAERLAWLTFLHREAREVLNHAMGAAPKVISRTYRSRAEAEGLFEGQMRRTFPLLFPKHEESAHG